jgi:hypothetical protein
MCLEALVINPDDIHSLTDFQRNAKGFVRRLRKSRRPELLTINGKAAVVVQDAAAFAEMIESFERAYTIEAVRVGIEQADAGKGVPLERAMRELRAKYGPRRKRRSA